MAAKRQVILHIGLPKTGTSFLQHTFAENAETLLRHGIHVVKAGSHPSFKDPGNHLLAMTLMMRRRADIAERVDKLGAGEAWEQAVAEIAGAEGEVSFISSELFAFDVSDSEDLEMIKSRLAAFEVKIVVVLRDVVELANSLYAQRVTDGFVGSPTDLVELYWPHLDWRMLVERWRAVFGGDNVATLEFNRHTRAYYLEYFITSTFPGRIAAALLKPSVFANRSFAKPLIELIAHLNASHPQAREQLVESLIATVADEPAFFRSGESYLSPDLARALRRHCRDPSTDEGDGR